MYQPGKVPSPARGQLNRENVYLVQYFPVPVPVRIVGQLRLTAQTSKYKAGRHATCASYMHVWSSYIATVRINRVRLPILLVVS